MLANRDRYLPIKPYIFSQELGDASFQFKNILDLLLTRVKQGNLHFIFNAVLRRITGLPVVFDFRYLLVEKSQYYPKSECYQLHFSVLAEILFYPQCELYLYLQLLTLLPLISAFKLLHGLNERSHLLRSWGSSK
jgi:hypothetical protein